LANPCRIGPDFQDIAGCRGTPVVFRLAGSGGGSAAPDCGADGWRFNPSRSFGTHADRRDGQGAGGNRVTVFDDGTDVNQVLADPVTLSFSDGSRMVSRTFPAGTQIEAECKVTFQSGFTMIGLRFQNPAALPDLINAGFAFLDSKGMPVIPPVRSLGPARSRR
jgi:hypothetical protein